MESREQAVWDQPDCPSLVSPSTHAATQASTSPSTNKQTAPISTVQTKYVQVSKNAAESERKMEENLF